MLTDHVFDTNTPKLGDNIMIYHGAEGTQQAVVTDFRGPTDADGKPWPDIRISNPEGPLQYAQYIVKDQICCNLSSSVKSNEQPKRRLMDDEEEFTAPLNEGKVVEEQENVLGNENELNAVVDYVAKMFCMPSSDVTDNQFISGQDGSQLMSLEQEMEAINNDFDFLHSFSDSNVSAFVEVEMESDDASRESHNGMEEFIVVNDINVDMWTSEEIADSHERQETDSIPLSTIFKPPGRKPQTLMQHLRKFPHVIEAPPSIFLTIKKEKGSVDSEIQGKFICEYCVWGTDNKGKLVTHEVLKLCARIGAIILLIFSFLFRDLTSVGTNVRMKTAIAKSQTQRTSTKFTLVRAPTRNISPPVNAKERMKM